MYFDHENARLVYVGKPADETYWDGHWSEDLHRRIAKPDKFVVSTTKKFLPVGSKVVDAGCGLARTVYGLDLAGYEAYGVDYATTTVAAINSAMPSLKVSFGDVRDMGSFETAFFDGLWSLGVIEHFYDGYGPILEETHRLIRQGGYAFVTVPSMSPLRKIKASLGLYPAWNGENKKDFYQFALSPKTIIRDFETRGFKLVSSGNRGGYKGLKDEASFLRPLMQKIYDSRALPARALLLTLDRLLTPFSFHTKLYVFRKDR